MIGSRFAYPLEGVEAHGSDARQIACNPAELSPQQPGQPSASRSMFSFVSLVSLSKNGAVTLTTWWLSMPFLSGVACVTLMTAKDAWLEPLILMLLMTCRREPSLGVFSNLLLGFSLKRQKLPGQASSQDRRLVRSFLSCPSCRSHVRCGGCLAMMDLKQPWALKLI